MKIYIKTTKFTLEKVKISFKLSSSASVRLNVLFKSLTRLFPGTSQNAVDLSVMFGMERANDVRVDFLRTQRHRRVQVDEHSALKNEKRYRELNLFQNTIYQQIVRKILNIKHSN